MTTYCQVSAFTETPGLGNQAAVVLSAQHLSDAEMQGMAARLGVPETVFLIEHQGGAARVRYFTPIQEIEFCGHATVALGLVLAQEGWWRGEDLELLTLSGRVPLELEWQDGAPRRVWMQQQTLEVRPVANDMRARLAQALGINERLIHRGLPLRSASTGLWSVFVPIVDSMVIDALEPDLAAISQLSQELGVTGVHPYAPVKPDTFYTRDFAPLVGIPEDPVTGSAAGALMALLAVQGTLPRRGNTALGYCLQGHAMGSPGEVVVEVTLDREALSCVRVGGCAVVDHEGKL